MHCKNSLTNNDSLIPSKNRHNNMLNSITPVVHDKQSSGKKIQSMT